MTENEKLQLTYHISINSGKTELDALKDVLAEKAANDFRRGARAMLDALKKKVVERDLWAHDEINFSLSQPNYRRL
jgi:hypothetical protein